MTDEEQAIGCSPSLSVAATVTNAPSTRQAQHTLQIRGGEYHKLAARMAEYPPGAIFGRFKWLHMLKLLYLQSDLETLERDFKRFTQDDSEIPDNERQVCCRGCQLLRCGSTEHGAWLKISEKLKEYDETIQATVALLKMPDVEKADLSFIRSWMKDPPEGSNLDFSSNDWDIWKTAEQEELFTMSRSNHTDPLTQWTCDKALPVYDKLIGQRLKKKNPVDSAASNDIYYNLPKIRTILSVLTISVASALPILATVILDSVASHKLKIGMMAVFTILFSCSLGLMSGPKMSDVFMASAAFAAVLVVFISGDQCCSKS